MKDVVQISDRLARLTKQEQERIVNVVEKLLLSVETGVKERQQESHSCYA